MSLAVGEVAGAGVVRSVNDSRLFDGVDIHLFEGAFVERRIGVHHWSLAREGEAASKGHHVLFADTHLVEARVLFDVDEMACIAQVGVENHQLFTFIENVCEVFGKGCAGRFNRGCWFRQSRRRCCPERVPCCLSDKLRKQVLHLAVPGQRHLFFEQTEVELVIWYLSVPGLSTVLGLEVAATPCLVSVGDDDGGSFTGGLPCRQDRRGVVSVDIDAVETKALDDRAEVLDWFDGIDPQCRLEAVPVDNGGYVADLLGR